MTELQKKIIEALLASDRYVFVCKKDNKFTYPSLSAEWSVLAARHVLEENDYEVETVYDLEDLETLADL